MTCLTLTEIELYSSSCFPLKSVPSPSQADLRECLTAIGMHTALPGFSVPLAIPESYSQNQMCLFLV